MKKKEVYLKLVFGFFLLIVTASFLSFNGNKEEKTIQTINSAPTVISNSLSDTTFLLGTLWMGYNSIENNPGDPYNWTANMKYIRDSLSMNAYIFYASKDITLPYDGDLDDDITLYAGNVNYFMSNIKNNGITGGIYDRKTFQKLAGAQRSTYQVEDTLKYGYYNNITPKTGKYFYNDQYGASGRCAKLTPSEGGQPDFPGYLVSGLIENVEQSDNWKYCGAGSRDDSTWHIKPRMRIDSIDAVNHLNDAIARIVIYSFDTTYKKEVVIKGSSFLDENGNYNGGYLEKFLFESDTINLQISGDVNHLNKGAHTTFNDSIGYYFPDCHVDYRIWWYGVCDLYVDYVRVDDYYAHNLFANTATGERYRLKIKDETMAFKDNIYHFYYDELRYNNIPCMHFVDSIIKANSGGNTSIVTLPFPAMNVGLNKNRQENTRAYLDALNPPFLISDNYAISTKANNSNEFYYCYLPHNLPPVNMPCLNVLYNTSSYNKYTNTIQESRLGDKSKNYDCTINAYNASYVSYLYHMKKDAEYKNKNFYQIMQIHSWLTMNGSNQLDVNIHLREPTNEEI